MTEVGDCLRVAIVDCGIDLHTLYNGERHGYHAVWVPVSDLTFDAVEDCDIVIIPAGSDSTLLTAKADHLRRYLNEGGWVFSFDGLGDGVFDGIHWRHTETDYKHQKFTVTNSDFHHLLNSVNLDGLETKDGVRGWWCEGELRGDELQPILVDQQSRTIVAAVVFKPNDGLLIVTAAARLPLFSSNTSLAANVFFKNLLDCRKSRLRSKRESVTQKHFYLHSGNFAQRSFMNSIEFGQRFTGVHWRDLTDSVLARVSSIWIPWESNVVALVQVHPMLEVAVANGATLVVEDLRGSWLPGVNWHARPVDSSWWRENRKLDLIAENRLFELFRDVPERAFSWHYHGVFDGPQSGLPLLKTSEGKLVLSLLQKPEWKGQVLVSTLDATFEFGVGKIKETRDYIKAVLRFVEASSLTVGTSTRCQSDATC